MAEEAPVRNPEPPLQCGELGTRDRLQPRSPSPHRPPLDGRRDQLGRFSGFDIQGLRCSNSLGPTKAWESARRRLCIWSVAPPRWPTRTARTRGTWSRRH